MRILLVTLSEYLPFALTQVLNQDLDYCAIVVDEPEVAKKILANVPQLRDKIYPFYELKECIQNFHYDFLLCVYPSWNELSKKFKKLGLPKNKLVDLTMIHTPDNFLLERAMRYFDEHAAEFEMFATGASRIQFGLDTTKFKRKLFNFGNTSEDLYYNYQVARHVLSQTGGGEK
ncbi:MAG: hypothetical protein IJT06_05590 [Selenomonadaceae bacterium]|nr:hypothetical protein [Selenomonadaceae bacterium]